LNNGFIQKKEDDIAEVIFVDLGFGISDLEFFFEGKNN